MNLEKATAEFVFHSLKSIHLAAIGNEGGRIAWRDEATLQFIASAALREEPTNLGLATHFLYEIATKHPFIDGNKRTATLSALLALYPETDPEPIFKVFYKLRRDRQYKRFILAVAGGKHTKTYVNAFLRKKFNRRETRI